MKFDSVSHRETCVYIQMQYSARNRLYLTWILASPAVLIQIFV